VTDERVAELVRRAYDGEVLGVELFDRLAALRPAEERDRLVAARDLEAATLSQATTLATDLGVDVGDGAVAREDGQRVADALAALPWDQLVDAVVTGTGVYRDLYASLAEVCDHPAVAELVAHEPALHARLRD
jgi:hypothetical protein